MLCTQTPVLVQDFYHFCCPAQILPVGRYGYAYVSSSFMPACLSLCMQALSDVNNPLLIASHDVTKSVRDLYMWPCTWHLPDKHMPPHKMWPHQHPVLIHDYFKVLTLTLWFLYVIWLPVWGLFISHICQPSSLFSGYGWMISHNYVFCRASSWSSNMPSANWHQYRAMHFIQPWWYSSRSSGR